LLNLIDIQFVAAVICGFYQPLLNIIPQEYYQRCGTIKPGQMV